MRCITLLLSLASLCVPALAQWTVTSAMVGARNDDIFFVNPDTGWVAGGADGWIERTYDGGATWQIAYMGTQYLRSIEFATPQIGFCGGLDSSFLRTTDGGATWQDISALLPGPNAICGLCAATPQVVYGVGAWFGPGYVIRSADSGVSWTQTSVSSMASALVDVHFLNADTGFVSGAAADPADGGVVLATVDGGATWTVRHMTNAPHEWVWKLQSPDGGQHIYGSLDAIPGTATRFLRSADRGATWTTDTADTDYHYMQMIGFLDTLHGWMGADDYLIETLDGGETWHEDHTLLGACFDRFHRVSATEAFMCGCGVYKYGYNSTGITTVDRRAVGENIVVVPDPASAQASVVVQVLAPSQAEIRLSTADGRALRTVFKGALPAGESRYPIDVSDLAPGTYFAHFRTNQGRSATGFLKE